MVNRRFICTRCGHRFEVQVFEPGEAQEKRLPAYPIQCPECRGPVEPA